LFILLPRSKCLPFALTQAVTWWGYCWNVHAWWHGMVWHHSLSKQSWISTM